MYVLDLCLRCVRVLTLLQREFSRIEMPNHFRERVRETLPTFAGAITDAPAIISRVTEAVPTQSSSSSSSSAPQMQRVVTLAKLATIDPWTILEGVAGTPLVQQLLATSEVVQQDGSISH
jgi:hypothetical protein